MWLRPSCVNANASDSRAKTTATISARVRHAASTGGAASDAGSTRGLVGVGTVFPVIVRVQMTFVIGLRKNRDQTGYLFGTAGVAWAGAAAGAPGYLPLTPGGSSAGIPLSWLFGCAVDRGLRRKRPVVWQFVGSPSLLGNVGERLESAHRAPRRRASRSGSTAAP